MTNTEFAAVLIALTRISTSGAKALAVSALIEEQKFLRVFSGRLPMPEHMSEQLAKQLHFDVRGYTNTCVTSALVKQVDDFERMVQLGFKWSPICLIASQRELNGGKPLQRYFVCEFTFGKTSRVHIVRMAAIKFTQLYDMYAFDKLPVVEIGSTDTGVLNDVSIELVDPDEKKLLQKAISTAQKGQLTGIVELVQRCVQDGISRLSKTNRRHVGRLTQSARVANTSERLQEWDDPTRNLSLTHHLYPINVSFKGVDGVGIRADETPVFVDVKTIARGGSCRIHPFAVQHSQQLVVFKQTGTDSYAAFEKVFDGPLSLVIELHKKESANKESRPVKVQGRAGAGAAEPLQISLNTLNRAQELLQKDKKLSQQVLKLR